MDRGRRNRAAVESLIGFVGLGARWGERRKMAGPTGLEPATSGVTGLRSNQLSYDPARDFVNVVSAADCEKPREGFKWWEVQDSNP